MSEAAVGFAHHSGWAVAVAVTGSVTAPVVLDRRRVELQDPGIPAQVFHAAEALDLPAARRLVDRATTAAADAAQHAIETLRDELRAAGHVLKTVGLAADPRPPLEDLAAILGSHPRLHMAEGDLYRDALVEAAGALGLPVVITAPKQMHITDALARIGKAIGPPWQKDHKHAALAALLALRD